MNIFIHVVTYRAFEYFNDATVIDRVFDDLEATAGITIRQHMTKPVL